MTDHDHPARETRQGQSGTRVLSVLVIGTAAAVVVAIAAYMIAFNTDDADVAAPTPALEQSGAAETVPPATSGGTTENAAQEGSETTPPASGNP